MLTRLAILLHIILAISYAHAESPDAAPDGPAGKTPEGFSARGGRGSGVTVTTGVSVIESSGDAGFAIGYGGHTISRLTYPLDGTLAEFNATVTLRQPKEQWGLRASGSYMTSVSVDGTTTDEDFDINGNRIHLSTADSDVEVTAWKVDGVFLFQPSPQDRSELLRSLELGFIVGYGASSMDFEDSDLVGHYNYGSQLVTSDGVVSTYDLDFEGARVGLSLDVKPAPKLNIGVRVVVIPNLEASSEAYWTLRDYPFWQSAEGDGVIVGIRATYQLTPAIEVHAAYRHVELIADENGFEDGILDGDSYYAEPIVDDMTAEYNLVEVGLGIRL